MTLMSARLKPLIPMYARYVSRTGLPFAEKRGVDVESGGDIKVDVERKNTRQCYMAI